MTSPIQHLNETDAVDTQSMRKPSGDVQRKDHFKPLFKHQPIPGLNEVKAHESEADAVDTQSMRKPKGEVQRKDHFKPGIGKSFLYAIISHLLLITLLIAYLPLLEGIQSPGANTLSAYVVMGQTVQSFSEKPSKAPTPHLQKNFKVQNDTRPIDNLKALDQNKKALPYKTSVDILNDQKNHTEVIQSPLTPDLPSSVSQSASHNSIAPAPLVIQNWLKDLSKAIQGHLNYPAISQTAGFKGQVMIQFGVLPSGVFTNISVAKSSGIPALDESALQAVQATSPVKIPFKLNNPVTLEIPVEFRYIF